MSGLLLPLLLMTTNDVAAAVPPTNHIVGTLWTYVAENGPATAVGPRLTCSVQHVGPVQPIFGGQQYRITLIIEPPGSDIRFCVLDRDIAIGYAKIITNWPPELKIWLVSAGAGAGQIWGGTNYFWGGPLSKVLRWGWSNNGRPVEFGRYYTWRFDQCAAADGDSGYAAFSEDGRYLGPISSGNNPSLLGSYESAGELAGAYLEWIRDYLPPTTSSPPKPQTPTALTVH